VTQDGAGYTAQVLMHIDSSAFSLRFDPAHIAELETAEAADAEPGDDTTEGGE
jgi:hypothetical protein